MQMATHDPDAIVAPIDAGRPSRGDDGHRGGSAGRLWLVEIEAVAAA